MKSPLTWIVHWYGVGLSIIFSCDLQGIITTCYGIFQVSKQIHRLENTLIESRIDGAVVFARVSTYEWGPLRLDTTKTSRTAHHSFSSSGLCFIAAKLALYNCVYRSFHLPSFPFIQSKAASFRLLLLSYLCSKPMKRKFPDNRTNSRQQWQ